MKKLILATAFVFWSIALWAQSKTTEALQKQFDSTLSLYFYKNTLRMLNQTENKEFDEMIKDIEKMKFLMVDKSTKNFGANEYKKLMKDYQEENYESIMTSRYEGDDENEEKDNRDDRAAQHEGRPSTFFQDIIRLKRSRPFR